MDQAGSGASIATKVDNDWILEVNGDWWLSLIVRAGESILYSVRFGSGLRLLRCLAVDR